MTLLGPVRVIDVVLVSSRRQSFTYVLADGAPGPAEGDLVWVPLGSRQQLGVSSAPRDLIESDPPLNKLKAPLAALGWPSTPDVKQLVTWASQYYRINRADIARTALGAAWPNVIHGYEVLAPADALFGGRDVELGQWLPAEWFNRRKIAVHLRHEAVRRQAVRDVVWFEDDRHRAATPEAPSSAAYDLVTPTAEQQAAIEAIDPKAAAQTFAPYVLQGITGSGKTEVYAHLIARARMRGQTALVLAPEIGIAEHVTQRMRTLFGDQVVTIHSALTDATRRNIFQQVRQGQWPIVVGARSAVFAPLQNLGVIIVDEEHDASYKQEDLFRYNGRDLAVKRAELAQCPVVLGSATPSLESFHNVQLGRYTRVHLRNRPFGVNLPNIVTIAHPAGHVKGPISDELFQMLDQTIKRQGQSLLFYNRRGWRRQVLCNRCDTMAACPHCSVGIVRHREAPHYRCHLCGFTTATAPKCATCGGTTRDVGWGTQRIEDWVKQVFADVEVIRIDRDVMDPADWPLLLPKLRDGQRQILIGTQMVSKGLDLPNLELVGILNADQGLSAPSFRSAERTFQEIMQVAGRAGRRDRQGTVAIQTMMPQHPAIASAIAGDVDRFAHGELALREALGYEPFRRSLLIRFHSPDDKLAQQAATVAKQAVDVTYRPNPRQLRVLGPAPAPIHKARNLHTWHIFVLSTSARQLRDIADTVDLVPRSSQVQISFDFDPVRLWL